MIPKGGRSSALSAAWIRLRAQRAVSRGDLGGANSEDIGFGHGAQVCGPQGHQPFGLPRGLDELHLDSIHAVELDNGSEIPGTEAVLREVTIQDYGI